MFVRQLMLKSRKSLFYLFLAIGIWKLNKCQVQDYVNQLLPSLIFFLFNIINEEGMYSIFQR